ncbi:MAG TPA: FliH/SctL family protein [Polyangiaceae bacterium]|jgi:flagellar biosynthesis/type III secretory pathway protein FliH
MSLTFGRVIARGELPETPETIAQGKPLRQGRRVERVQVEASERAQQILERAELRAAELVERARSEAAQVRLVAEMEGRAEAAAAIAARELASKIHESQALERELDRIVELARLLAERLLGHALRVDPAEVAALARQALREARGARRISIEANPADIEFLQSLLGELGAQPDALVFIASPAQARGNLRIVTEVGVLDAELAPQLERLAYKLRESLRS